MTLDEYTAELQAKQIEASDALKSAERAVAAAEITLANLRDAKYAAYVNDGKASASLKYAYMLKEKRTDAAFMRATQEMLGPLDKMSALSAIILYAHDMVALHGTLNNQIRLTSKGESIAAILRQLA